MTRGSGIATDARSVALAVPALLLASACGGATTTGAPASSDAGAPGDGAQAADAPANDGPTEAADATDASGAPDVASPDDGGGATDSGSGCPPAPTDGGACNALAAMGSPVMVQCVDAGSMPAPSGGAIVDGTYVLTSIAYYGPCPPAESDRITWLVCGSAWQTVQEFTIGTRLSALWLNATVTPNAASLDVRVSCSSQPQMSTMFGYDATPTRLNLYVQIGASGVGRVDTYVRL